jgi:hypothetical protein
LSSYRIFLVFLFFVLINATNCFSQNDSDKIKIGPEELQISKGGHYFNYSDKNKVNIEVIVLGIGAGKYLIPQGTSLFDLLIMLGGTDERTVDEIKVVRFNTETPILKGYEVKEYNYADLYGDPQDILKPQKNPLLKPGDMVILPSPRDATNNLFTYIRDTIAFVGTLVSFYFLIDNLVYRTYR